MTPTTPEAIIFEALMARLNTLVLSPVMPIAIPRVPFVPPADRRFLRVQLMPNTTERLFIGSNDPHRHYGIFQVMVVWAADEGDLPSQERAGLVATHFKADTKMVYGDVTVRSMKRPDVAPSYDDGADLLTPVTIEYESFI